MWGPEIKVLNLIMIKKIKLVAEWSETNSFEIQYSVFFTQKVADKGGTYYSKQELISASPLLQVGKETINIKTSSTPVLQLTQGIVCSYWFYLLITIFFSVDSEIALLNVTNNFRFPKSWLLKNDLLFHFWVVIFLYCISTWLGFCFPEVYLIFWI